MVYEFTVGVECLALGASRCTEPEALDDEGVVVLLFPLAVRPLIGSDVGLEES